jgi:hypothetical protein
MAKRKRRENKALNHRNRRGYLSQDVRDALMADVRQQRQLTSLTLQGVDDIEGGDSLALGVLSVGDSVTDDTLKEGLENTTGLLVDHSRDTLDTTTTGETTDSGLGDTLDVVTQDLAVTLGTALSETLSTLSACYRRNASVFDHERVVVCSSVD